MAGFDAEAVTDGSGGRGKSTGGGEAAGGTISAERGIAGGSTTAGGRGGSAGLIETSAVAAVARGISPAVETGSLTGCAMSWPTSGSLVSVAV
jgi:hypothetical protein